MEMSWLLLKDFQAVGQVLWTAMDASLSEGQVPAYHSYIQFITSTIHIKSIFLVITKTMNRQAIR